MWEAAELQWTCVSQLNFLDILSCAAYLQLITFLHLAFRIVLHLLGDRKTVARIHCCLPAISHSAT